MPKIVINEYDLTKAGTSEYANFSVVVPGFLAADKYVLIDSEDGATNAHWELNEATKAVFDENGIYECNNLTDFVNNVGKRAATITTRSTSVAAIPPKPSKVIAFNPNLAQEDYKYEKDPVSGLETFTYRDFTAYTQVFNATLAGFAPEYRENENVVDLTAIFPTVGKSEDADKMYSVCHATPNSDGVAGELKTKTTKYVAEVISNHGTVIMPDAQEATEDATLELMPYVAPTYNEYYVIRTDSYEKDGKNVPYKGQNGSYVEDRISHYGNQIAYELLSLGYTVLFKAMTEYSLDELNALALKDENLAKENNTVKEDAGAKYLAPEASAISQLSDPNFWECLKDKSTYDFRYLVTGLLTHNDGANKCILEVADHSEEILLDDASISDGRGDCIALIDLDCKAYVGKTQSEAIPFVAKEAAEWSSAYAAVFAPYVTYLMADDAEYDNNKTFPASFHYLACAANSANNNFSEWYANAGYTRGVSKYTIESTGCKFGEIAIQALEPRFLLKVGTELNDANTEYLDINTSVAVNLIVKIKSSYYLWGNRTGKKLGTRGASDGDLVAQHFLNIRRLATTIKKQIYVTCRRLTFDPNSNILWLNFVSLLRPMLEGMKNDQGIKDYKFVQDATDRKALLKARIRIVPIEAVEDFEIGLYLEDNLAEVTLTEA